MGIRIKVYRMFSPELAATLTSGLAILLATDPQLINGQVIHLTDLGSIHPGFQVIGANSHDLSGCSIDIAGDVNGDGLSDLIVGARQAAVGVIDQAGVSYVIFGKTEASPVSLSSLSNRGFRIDGIDAGDRSGSSVSGAGDVNGDGFADIIIGVRKGDTPGGVNAGEAFVVFGKSDSEVVRLSSLGARGFRIDGFGFGSYLGTSVAGAGDINSDGLSDLIVGAPGEGNTGRSYVIFGKTDANTVDTANLGAKGFLIEGRWLAEGCGGRVAGAGDVNGDGHSDVIVGAEYGRGIYPAVNANAYVVFGKSNNTPVLLSNLGSGGFGISVPIGRYASGISVSSAGDFNGDGLADVIWGIDNLARENNQLVGGAYVVFGKTGSSDVWIPSLGTNGIQIRGWEALGHFGNSVACAGDVNGDGLSDVVVGAPQSGYSEGIRGKSYLILGRTGTDIIEVSTTNFGGCVFAGGVESRSSGSSVSGAGDVDGDGRADSLVGAPDAGTFAQRRYQHGATFVVLSGPIEELSTLHPQASYRKPLTTGPTRRQGVGAHGRDDATVFPDSRAWVDFNAGTGPGMANSSEVTATITRNDAGLDGFDPLTTANVQWQFTTNRTAWTTCRVTVRYTDAEIAGLTEGSLLLYTAPTAAGPFVPAANFTLTPGRNEAAGDVDALPAVFVLSTAPPGVFILDGDANDDGVVDIADVTALHNHLAGIASLTPDGVANLANIGGVSVAAANAILDHLANGAPLP